MTVGTNVDRGLIAILRSALAPLTEDRGLPNVAYTDAQLFAFERDYVLGRSWAAIAYASELSGPGSAKPIDFMGVPLLILRGKQNELNVFHNVCRHRGMTLVSEQSQLKTVIRCPYHSWSYDFDGRLLATPHVGGNDKHSCAGFDRADHSLRPVRFAVWMDIIFINLSGRAVEFPEFIAPLERRWSVFLGDQGVNQFRAGANDSTLELPVSCNWKLAVENYCEAYHLPWVHPDLNSYSPLDQHYNIADEEGFSGQESHRYELASVAGIELPGFQCWPEDKRAYAEYVSLYPNTLLGIQADHAFSVIVSPQAPGRSLEKLQVLYADDAAQQDTYAACRETILKSWDTVFREDVFVVEGMQAGRQSPGFDGGVFTPVQDVPTHQFHRWVANSYLAAIDAADSS